MNKNSLLKLIAQKGYVISYAANLNFATYDIVTSLPRRVSYISLAVSIIGLVFSGINSHWITVPILLVSIACIYTDKYTKNIEAYAERGKNNTQQWNELKNLYFKVKDTVNETDFHNIIERYKSIESSFNSSAEYDQILFANWYAHYKLFVEKDYHWMDEQIHFGWWKDKVPGSFKFFIIISILIVFFVFCINCPVVYKFISGLFDFCYK